MLQSWNITTGDTNAWQVARLLQAPSNTVAGKKADIIEEVFKNYVNGFSTVANPDKTLSKGGNLNYGNVMQDMTFGNHFVTTAEAKTGPFTNSQGTPYIAKDIDSPGYYAFQTEFLSPEILDLSGLFLNIDISMQMDDGLEGIFLNGQEITKYSSLKGTSGLSNGNAITLGVTGSVSLDDLIDHGLFALNATNTLEFIVRNVNNSDNPIWFGALGEINISDQQEFAHSFNPTPEPATLLICLTCGGLALAIRRRKNKKTE
ncbi:MAG: PEP-CTERM sorting domain-containing protein [Planctomycetaceae bacterium]|nr:PEP-CTERM sorting domain-containing protein [Planctomycetaceae bacterium]